MSGTPDIASRMPKREQGGLPRKAHPLAPASPLAPREPGSQLLGGFAGRDRPKHHATSAFPQVSKVDAAQHPPITAQKSRTHGKIGTHFLQNHPEVAECMRQLNNGRLFASKTGHSPSDKLLASRKVFKRKGLLAPYGSQLLLAKGHTSCKIFPFGIRLSNT